MTGFNPIWLVEDSENDIELVLNAFRENNLANSVIVMRDGEEALRHLRALEVGAEAAPIVILLDIKMPKAGGIEVLRKIKGTEQLKCLPVVMLTSSRQGPDIETCYKIGANAFVCKPVEFTAFFETMTILGDFWAVLNECPQADHVEGAVESSANSEMKPQSPVLRQSWRVRSAV